MRLPNGYGSAYKQSGNRRKPYAARIVTGWSDDGKPKYAYLGYFKTRHEALECLANYNKSPYDVSKPTSFKDAFEAMLSDKLANKETANRMEYVYRHSFESLGGIANKPIADIRLKQLQVLMDSIDTTVGQKTKIKIVISETFKYACKMELCPSDRNNYAKLITIGNSTCSETKKQDRGIYTSEEIQTLWEHSDNDNAKILLMLIYSGCRVMELLDLKRENVHLSERYIYIAKSKTKAGIREVPIAECVVPFYKYFLSQNNDLLINYWIDFKQRLKVAESRIFATLKELNIDRYIHDTRHTCISLLVMHNVDDRTIKTIVGHEGGDVTSNYTHIKIEEKLKAINLIGKDI